jgi:hypothetical protein
MPRVTAVSWISPQEGRTLKGIITFMFVNLSAMSDGILWSHMELEERNKESWVSKEGVITRTKFSRPGRISSSIVLYIASKIPIQKKACLPSFLPSFHF